MFKTLRAKVIGAFLLGGLLTTLLFSQAGPQLRIPAGSETQPGLVFYLDSLMGFYRNAAGDMGFGFETISFEGVTADASETQLQVAEPTADNTYIIPTDAADSYDILAVPDADQALAFLANPIYGWTADAIVPVDATIGDLEMYVQRFYLPFPMTVGAVYGINEAGAQTAGSAGDLGAAIYEDLDAGAIVFSCTFADAGGDGAIDCDGTDVKLYPGWYRLGLCGEDVSDEMWGGALEVDALAATTWNTFPLTSLIIGESTNDCTSTAIVPATTGALEDSATEIVFWVLAPDA